MITIISGTNRHSSNSLKLAKILENFYETEGVETKLLNLSDLPSAAFDPNAYGGAADELTPWKRAILDARGLHLVIPEYNGSFPGILKLFIDLLPFPESFEERPVAFTGLSAGQFGALRAVEQMQLIFGYRNAYIFPNRVFLPAVHKSLSEEGKLLDQDIAKRLESQVTNFLSFVNTLKV